MNAQELVSDLQVKGARFHQVTAQSFTVKAPSGLITAELKELLTERKPEIISLLTRTESRIEARFFKGLELPTLPKAGGSYHSSARRRGVATLSRPGVLVQTPPA